MASLATTEQLPRLMALWQLCFGDEMDYIRFVFGRLLTPDKIMVQCDKTGSPIAMLCMEPLQLRTPEQHYDAVYLYAFCVHPDYRGKKVGAQLLKSYDQYLKAQGIAASVLTPANQKLFGYYQNLGYQVQFAVKNYRWLPRETAVHAGEPKSPVVLVGRSFDELYQLRNTFFRRTKLFGCWSPSYLRFVDEECRQRGGEVLSVTIENIPGYLVYRKDTACVELTEFAVLPEFFDATMQALHRRLAAPEYRVRLEPQYPENELLLPLPFAMVKWYDKVVQNVPFWDQCYLSHVMD